VKIVGLMVTRNEADRYLRKALESLAARCDRVAVFDDQSDDDTCTIAAEFGLVQRRPDDVATFLEHEGQFRQAAWDWAAHWFMLDPGDWVVSLDADELLHGDLRYDILSVKNDVDGLLVPIDEIWELDPAKRRVDGWWGKIVGFRARRWEPGLKMPDKAMASGSVPPVHVGTRADHGRIRHLGYVRAADRQAKHDRYIAADGHGRSHVQSILRSPTLETVEWS
jgi:glycosyltransferase involved in cell wall biosynthesis